jgi:threonine/homoserine/homoserine lactone efflux protein
MIIIAFFIGLIFSVPIGPLGMIILKRSVEKGFWEGFTIAIIDAIAGFVFSLSFLIGIGQLELDPTIKLIAQLLGLVFLFWIGIKEVFFKKNKYEKNITLNKGSLLGNLILVIGYYIANPSLWAFWINVSVYANSNLLNERNLFNSILFSLFYALGVLTTQYLAIQLMKNIEQFEKVKIPIKYVSSFLFIVTFIYFFYTSLQSIGSQWNTFAQMWIYYYGL